MYGVFLGICEISGFSLRTIVPDDVFMFFDVFEGFYYVSDMFSGTNTGTILVLGVYIVYSTRGIVGGYVFFIDVLLAPLGAISREFVWIFLVDRDS